MHKVRSVRQVVGRDGPSTVLTMLRGCVLALLWLPGSQSIECNVDGGEYMEQYWLMFPMESCHECPLGRYRRAEMACNQLSGQAKECPKCTPCPEGRSTKQKASTTEEACDVEWNVTSFMHSVSILIVDAFLASLVVLIPCCCLICYCCRLAGKDSARADIARESNVVTVGARNTSRHGSKSSVRPDGCHTGTVVNIGARKSTRNGSKDSTKGIARADTDGSSNVFPVSATNSGSRQGSKTSNRAREIRETGSSDHITTVEKFVGDTAGCPMTFRPTLSTGSSNLLKVAPDSSSRHGSKNSVRPSGTGNGVSSLAGPKSPRSRSHRSVRILDPAHDAEQARWAFPSPKEAPKESLAREPRGSMSVQEYQDLS
ncbi:unnamed protein product [Symbiodinium sp. CCMP2456]|nr:unnamed protein product [Symbiodinium sp. CCMP2456]